MRPSLVACALALAVWTPPAAAQAPVCPSTVTYPYVLPPTCQLGQFTVEAWLDVFSPLAPGPQHWGITLYDDRIDLSFRYALDQFSATAPEQLGESYPFFEHRLYFFITPLTPGGFWQFGAGMATSAKATFTLPSATSWASLYSEVSVSNHLIGSGSGAFCDFRGVVGTADCQLGSDRRALPFNTLPFGNFYGYVTVQSWYQNDGPGLMTADYEDVSFTASIYFDRPLTPVPEPATVGLLALGLVGLGIVERRRRHRASYRRFRQEFVDHRSLPKPGRQFGSVV